MNKYEAAYRARHKFMLRQHVLVTINGVERKARVLDPRSDDKKYRVYFPEDTVREHDAGRIIVSHEVSTSSIRHDPERLDARNDYDEYFVNEE